jgi:hypothetical protein
MRRVLACLLVMLVLAGVLVPPAHAGGAAGRVALGLAAFAVFNQFVYWHARPAYAERVVVYTAPPPAAGVSHVVYAAPHVVLVQPPQPAPTVVEYPHGRYELRGDGVSTAYQWVWIPRVPPPPPPPPGPPPPPPTSSR